LEKLDHGKDALYVLGVRFPAADYGSCTVYANKSVNLLAFPSIFKLLSD